MKSLLYYIFLLLLIPTILSTSVIAQTDTTVTVDGRSGPVSDGGRGVFDTGFHVEEGDSLYIVAIDTIYTGIRYVDANGVPGPPNPVYGETLLPNIAGHSLIGCIGTHFSGDSLLDDGLDIHPITGETGTELGYPGLFGPGFVGTELSTKVALGVAGNIHFAINDRPLHDNGGSLKVTIIKVQSTGLVAYYKFDGNPLDESSYKNDGSVVGGVTWGMDRFGQSGSAAQFNGTDSYILVPNSASLQSPSNELTIAGWIYITSFQMPVAGIVTKTISSTHGQYNFAYWEAPGGGLFYNQNGGSQSLHVEEFLDLNRWYFIALTKAADDTVKMFLDDNIIGTGIIQEQLSPDDNPLAMGLDTFGEWEYLDGKLDDIRIYNRALTDEEILELYNFIIPVELTSFIASIDKNIVLLKWTTSTETNNRGFEIEKSTNVYEWDKIGFVNGNGTSTKPHYYSFTDEIRSIEGSLIKYRLKQIDYDGTFEYSYEVLVEIPTPKDYALLQNHPNPWNPTTTIKYQIPLAGMVTIKVYDVLGNEVATLIEKSKEPGGYEVSFDGSDLSSGVYVYQLRVNDYVSTKKMLLMK